MISIFSKLITILIFSVGSLAIQMEVRLIFRVILNQFLERCLDCHGPETKSAFRVDQRVQ